MNHLISVFSVDTLGGGDREISQIRTHDGFMGQAIASVSCLAFHPLLLRLAAGFADTESLVSVYALRDR